MFTLSRNTYFISVRQHITKVVLFFYAGQDFNGTNAIVAGWGRTRQGVMTRPGYTELNKVDLPLMSIEECAESKYKPNRITKNMFCAGFIQGRKDSCQVS